MKNIFPLCIEEPCIQPVHHITNSFSGLVEDGGSERRCRDPCIVLKQRRSLDLCRLLISLLWLKAKTKQREFDKLTRYTSVFAIAAADDCVLPVSHSAFTKSHFNTCSLFLFYWPINKHLRSGMKLSICIVKMLWANLESPWWHHEGVLPSVSSVLCYNLVPAGY